MVVLPTPETIQETLCLDYANSVEWSSEDEHPDVLRTGEMLGRWGPRRDGAASGSQPPKARHPLPRARLRMAVPQHQRTTPLVLNVDLRQPRKDAAAAPTPNTTHRLTSEQRRARTLA